MEQDDWNVQLNFKDVKAIRFSKSKYLQSRIKQEFNTKVQVISISFQPVTAIIKGDRNEGRDLNFKHYNFLIGTDITAKRDTQVAVDEKVTRSYLPCTALQRKMRLDVYITPADDAKYIDDPLVNPLGKWSIELPLSLHNDDHSILFTLIIGSVEIQATGVNSGIGDIYETTFDLDI
ncbi:12164_t:CDS:2 [Funneliformis caledonium]|uniref:12164_t:CDS:1 n=1 Tax=Funneliformis caledonium TaxID=1117310 RepID=A0A9N9CB19_9GLOM|nr:12164_t:CDS:2 [Funneliformis caledonium]